MSPSAFIAQKVPVPSEMLTRDWSRVQAETRERAFFMAAVTNAEILDVFQSAAEDVAAGKVNKARAREIIRERLAALGYKPAPGTEGGIKDLTSFQRINTVLETNHANAQGWAAYQKHLAAVRVFPAKRMVRLTLKKEPRNWPQRWRLAGAAIPAAVAAVGLNVADMSAHLTHPIWWKLSRFQQPYPLYDFGSGMGDKILPLDEAKELGIDQPPPPENPTAVPAELRGESESGKLLLKPSLNHALESSPDIRTRAVKDALTRHFKGAARWERVKVKEKSESPAAEDQEEPPSPSLSTFTPGERLVYLDPNGTRPDTAENLANIIRARPYPDAPIYQYEAAARYVAEGPQSFTRGSDALYDLARLVHRTIPMGRSGDILSPNDNKRGPGPEVPATVPPLWSVRLFETAADLAQFIAALDSPGGLPALPGWPFLVCDPDPARALTDVPEGALVITINRARTARDLRPVLATLPAGADLPGVFIEAGTRLKIVRRQTTGGVTQIVCEEISTP